MVNYAPRMSRATAPRTLTSRFWRGRRSAAVAGIVFGVLLLAALTMVRLALSDTDIDSLRSDPSRRALIGLSLNLVPFAGIAFLWFIGVVRDQLGEVEDRLFSTVFLGSGLLFLAMLFVGSVTTSTVLSLVSAQNASAELFDYGRVTTQGLISVYALRMAAVFTLSVSTVGMRTGALPRWVAYSGYVVALGLMVAAGEHKWVQLVFPAWVLMVSVVILATSPSDRGTVT